MYLFQSKGIWFISSKLGSMSGYAYSEQGEECPTELEWTNHQGRIENLVGIDCVTAAESVKRDINQSA